MKTDDSNNRQNHTHQQNQQQEQQNTTQTQQLKPNLQLKKNPRVGQLKSKYAPRQLKSKFQPPQLKSKFQPKQLKSHFYTGQPAQLKKKSEEEPKQLKSKSNNTGLPTQLKTNMENMTGVDLSDTKVHYNSNKPAQLQAHAYAQGTDIHLASGQEKHLGHELAHVVQQKQGRVKPTTQLKGIGINDDSALEKEADVMGAKAMQMKTTNSKPLSKGNTVGKYVQMKPDPSKGLKLRGSVGVGGDNYLSDVKAIQSKLYDLGYFGSGEYNQNIWDNPWSYVPFINGKDEKFEGDLSATTSAIFNFQQQNVLSITPDGLISPNAQTIKALNNFNVKKGNPKKATGHLGGITGAVGRKGENLAKDVLRIQKLLIRLKYQEGRDIIEFPHVNSDISYVESYGFNEQIPEDHILSTINAIETFQRHRVKGLKKADGLIEQNQLTIQTLTTEVTWSWKDKNGLNNENLESVKVYMFYDATPNGEHGGFPSQTMAQYKAYQQQYGYNNVVVNSCRTEAEFAKAWQDMEGEPELIVMNLHGSDQALHLDSNPDGIRETLDGEYIVSTNDGTTNVSGTPGFRISDLPQPKADISKTRLLLNSCNSSTESDNYNKGEDLLAEAFSKTGVDKVRSSDSKVNFEDTGNMEAYPSYHSTKVFGYKVFGKKIPYEPSHWKWYKDGELDSEESYSW